MITKFKNYLQNTREINMSLSFSEDYLFKEIYEKIANISGLKYEVIQIHSSNIFPELVKYTDQYYIVIDTHLHEIICRYYTNIVIASNMNAQGILRSQDITDLFKSNGYSFLSWGMFNDDFCSFQAALNGKTLDRTIKCDVNEIDLFHLDVFEKLVHIYIFHHEHQHLAIRLDSNHQTFSKNQVLNLLDLARKLLALKTTSTDELCINLPKDIDLMENSAFSDYLDSLLADSSSNEFEEVMCDVMSMLHSFNLINSLYNKSSDPLLEKKLYTMVISQYQMITNLIHLMEQLLSRYLSVGQELSFNLKRKVGQNGTDPLQLRQQASYLLASVGITHKLISSSGDKNPFNNIHDMPQIALFRDLNYAYQDIFNKYVLNAMIELNSNEEMSNLFIAATALKRDNASAPRDYGTLRNLIFDWK